MNQIIVSHVKAFILTFVSTFFVAFGTQLTGIGHVEITSTLVVGLLISSAQVALKEILERNTPTTLGGRKG